MGKDGVPAAARSRQYSIESAGSMVTPRKPATFRDIGAVFDASSGVSDEQHQRLRDWAQVGTPLSQGMALASPARIQAFSPFDHRAANNHRAGPRRVNRISTFSADEGDGTDKRLNRVLSKIAENAMEEDNDDEAFGVGMNTYQAGDRGMHRMSLLNSELDGTSGKIDTFSNDIEMTGLGLDHCFSGDLDHPNGVHTATRRSPRAKDPAHEHEIRPSQSHSPRHSAPPSHGSAGAAMSSLSSLTLDILDPSTWLEPAIAHTERHFAIQPTPQARGVTPRQAHIAASYTRTHGIPNLELDMADLVPMISFLDGWLSEMQQNEWTYDYHNPKYVLSSVYCCYVCVIHSDVHFQQECHREVVLRESLHAALQGGAHGGCARRAGRPLQRVLHTAEGRSRPEEALPPRRGQRGGVGAAQRESSRLDAAVVLC